MNIIETFGDKTLVIQTILTNFFLKVWLKLRKRYLYCYEYSGFTEGEIVILSGLDIKEYNGKFIVRIK